MSSTLVIKEVTDKKGYDLFVRFPFKLYKNNPYWVPPIIADEIETIDPNVNPVYQNAEARFYLAYKGNEIVGRIAAIINWIEVNDLGKSKVRFGWFDTIDDVEVSRMLLEKVIAVGKANKLSTIEGPVGFSNLDKAGLLVYGFEELNTMITNYNAPYYQEHFKMLGFKKLAQWVEYEIQIHDYSESPEKVKRFSDIVMERYKLQLVDFKSRKDIVPYVDEMFELLDKTYNKLQTFVPIQPYQIEHYKKRFIRFMNPKFIKCVVDNKGDMIAFSITLPSFTKALKKVNGKLSLMGYLHLFKAMYFNNRASFYLIGIRPDFQNKGITAIIFNEMQKSFNAFGITTVETNPELEENSAIQKLWKNYTHRLHKKKGYVYERALRFNKSYTKRIMGISTFACIDCIDD